MFKFGARFGLGVMSLRLVATIMVATLMSQLSPAFVAADDLHSAPPELACRQELIFLDLWRVQSVVRTVEYQHERRGELEVYSGQWHKTPAVQQRAIALAAFCKIAVRYGSGELTVGSGREIWGSVINGACTVDWLREGNWRGEGCVV